MAKKMIVTGKPARRIEVSGKPQRRIEPDEFAAAVGVEPVGEAHAPNLDPVSLAALGSELIKRLRSSGGRPALADATEICRVPLSAEDLKSLERLVAQLEASSGARPSVGQLVSVIVRAHLQALKAARLSEAAADAGADAVTLVNTFPGMAIDWRRRKPILGNVVGGLSGPAIKPIVLRIVWQVARKVQVPIIAVGGIGGIDDVMEYLVAGASAVQIGTANFYNPTLAGKLVDELDAALASAGCQSVQEIVGTLQVK